MQNSIRYQKARTVSFVNAGTNTLLAITKIVIGVIGHSHALIADGLHSFSDLFGDLLVWIAAKLGGRHPDREHPYGHQRIETVASILIALLLIGVAVSIVYDGGKHLTGIERSPAPDAWVILVAVLSILANEWLYRYTLKASRSIQSQLLRSYALHNRSDVYVSCIVLVSVVGALIGWVYFDAIGAILIALLIFKMGAKMIWQSLQELIDTGVDAQTLQQITTCIAKTPGVQAIHQLRTRTHSHLIFVDVHIIVDPRLSVSEGHFVSDQVHKRLHQTFPAMQDITVHIDPEDDELQPLCVDLPDRPTLTEQLKTAWHALPGYDTIQTMQLHYLNGKIHIELFLHLNHIPDDLPARYQAAVQHDPHIASVTLYAHIGPA